MDHVSSVTFDTTDTTERERALVAEDARLSSIRVGADPSAINLANAAIYGAYDADDWALLMGATYRAATRARDGYFDDVDAGGCTGSYYGPSPCPCDYCVSR